MKILICSFEYPPHGSGIANVAFNLRNSFADLGHKVYVCSPDGPEIKRGSWPLIELFGGLGIIHFWWRTGQFLRRHMDSYDAILLENPLLCHQIYSPKLRITTHTTYAAFWEQVIRERKSRPMQRAYYSFLKRYERWSFRRLDRRIPFTSASDNVTEELVGLGISPEKIIFISNGAEISRFKPRPEEEKRALKAAHGLDPEKRSLVFVGRLEPQHRPQELVRIFSGIKAKKDVQLVIVGSGTLEKEVKALVADSKLQDVIFIPHIPYTKLHEIYQAGDFFILHSVYTGQSLALLEALSSGCLPLLPADVPAFKELVADSGAGCAYRIRPKEATADILAYMRCVKIKPERQKLRKYVEKNFSWAASANKYLVYFRKENA